MEASCTKVKWFWTQKGITVEAILGETKVKKDNFIHDHEVEQKYAS
jgi:hypothetical protein